MNNNAFNLAKKKLGFGFMRLPMQDRKIDHEQVKVMVDKFIENGFNYFDTAHGYHGGLSEKAIKECLTSRYDRSQYLLANKLSEGYFKTNEDIRTTFFKQLEICGVDYFDYYLMHAQNRKNFEHYKTCKAYEEAFKLKKEGYIKHVGLSFHDTVDILEEIITTYPDVEFVQIQFNYLDYDSKDVQSKLLLELLEKHHIPAIVMEPVRGGALANLSSLAKAEFDKINKNQMSYASYAIRYAASFDNVKMVLSGMSNINQLNDNISYMQDFQPLNKEELETIKKVVKIIKNRNVIGCTNCQYCIEGCPKHISIPNLFLTYNMSVTNRKEQELHKVKYQELTKNGNLASACIKCGKCEQVCPQHLPIRKLLEKVAIKFE